METIEHIDRSLFFLVNGLHSNSLDTAMFWISSTALWIPFYVFLAVLLFKSIGKKILPALMCVALLIVLSDQTSNLIKKQVQRYRPSHNLEMQGQVHIVNDYYGGQFGFVSSHAANAFGLVAFLIFLFKEKKNWFKLVLIFWAALVSYSRIYLGVHYPSDIIGGALVGIGWAVLLFVFYNWLSRSLQPDAPN